jgi:hypothetical protein
VFIIFGWEKIEKPLGEVRAVQCFDCQRESPWMVWNTSEWVTFSAIKVLRFINRHDLRCTTCSSTLALQPSEFKQIDRHMRTADSIAGTPIHSALAARVEQQQLAQKTPLQLKFIRETMKAKREYEERMAAVSRPDAARYAADK